MTPLDTAERSDSLRVSEENQLVVASRQEARPQPGTTGTATLQAAEREFATAYYSDASSDTIIAAGRAMGEAREAVESIDQRCFRLGLKAAEKDAEAERHMVAAADAAGRAAGRRLRWGNDALVASFDREELACTTLAADAMAEATRLRSQCAALRRAQRYADDVVGMLEAAE